MTAVKMLEEKFLAHIHQLQNKQFTVKIEELIHDLALIAQESQEVIAEGIVSIEKNTTVFIDGLSLEEFIDAEICQRIKKYQGSKVKLILEVQE